MITVIVLPGCLDQYLVPQNREEKEKKKKSSPSCKYEEKGVDYEQLSETYPIPEVQLFWHKSMKTQQESREESTFLRCHLSVAYPSFTCRRQDEKKQPGSSSRNGCCIHFKRAACRKSSPVSIQCKLAGLESYKLSVPSSVTYYEQTYWAAKIFLVQPIPAFFGSSCSSSLSSHALFHSLLLPCSFSSLAPITTCFCCWSAQIYSTPTNS